MDINIADYWVWYNQTFYIYKYLYYNTFQVSSMNSSEDKFIYKSENDVTKKSFSETWYYVSCLWVVKSWTHAKTTGTCTYHKLPDSSNFDSA